MLNGLEKIVLIVGTGKFC